MRPRRAGRSIAVVADVRLRQHVADRAVGEGLTSGARSQANRRRRQAVERVVGNGLAQTGVSVAARQRFAKEVIGVGLALHRVAAAG